MSTPPASKLSENVGFEHVRDYLKHRGWRAVPSRRSSAAIYRLSRGGQTDAEVVVPLERDFADYADAIEAIARRAAAVEGRTPEAVLHDLLQPNKDILRFALQGNSTKSGTIALLDGVALLNGAKKCLLASAMSAKRPLRFHPRMSLMEAEEFVAASRMGQTELGSFVLTLETPLYVSSEPSSSGSAFGRKATEHLMRATEVLTRSIRQDTADSVLLNEESPLVSANLCEALVQIMPSDESEDLHLRSTWSPLLPATLDAPTHVRIDRNMFEAIEQVGQRLRPTKQPVPSVFYGFVTELTGGVLAEGYVKLRILHDDELLDVRANLEREDYEKAADAHLHQRLVQVHGVLHRGRRVHEIRDIQSFTVTSED